MGLTLDSNSSLLMIMEFFTVPISEHRQCWHRLKCILLTAALAIWPIRVFAQEQIVFSTTDGALIYADLYGEGPRGLVLAHGGQFNKDSWREQAQQFVEAGFRVLAFDFRGYGESGNPGITSSAELRHLDVIAAIAYLRRNGDVPP